MRDNSGNFLKLSFCVLVLHPGFQVSAVSPYIGKTAMCSNFFTACRRVFFPVSDSGLNPEPFQFLIKGTETFFHDNGYIFPVALYRICQFADFQVRIQVKPVLGQCCPYFRFQFILGINRQQAAAAFPVGQYRFYFLAAISRNIQASPLFNTETGLKTKKAAFNKESSFFLFI